MPSAVCTWLIGSAKDRTGKCHLVHDASLPTLTLSGKMIEATSHVSKTLHVVLRPDHHSVVHFYVCILVI